MNVKKIITITALSCIFLFLIGITSTIATTIESPLQIEYPEFPNIDTPEGHPVFLPDYIRYIYYFAIISGGIIAFSVVIAGGFRYLTSVGNPAQTTDARNQIIMALVGLAVIFGSYIVLNEINPDLVSIQPPIPSYLTGEGIIIYSDSNCGDGSNGYPGLYKEVPLGIKYGTIKGTQSVRTIDVQSFWTLESTPYLSKIEFFRNSDCLLDPLVSHTFIPDAPNVCVSVGVIAGVECIKLTRHIPGVWLFSYENGDPKNPDPTKGVYKVFQGDWSNLPDGLRNNVRTIALVPDTNKGITYGTIMHERTGPRYEEKGWAHLYIPSNNGMNTTIYTGAQVRNTNIDSITVFQTSELASNRAVTVFENSDERCQPDGAGVCQPAKIRHKWSEMDPIPGIDNNIAKSITLEEGVDEWWTGGDFVATCSNVSAMNWIGHITWRTGGCFKGVSAIKFEEGSSYIAILYNDRNNGMVIDGSIRNLGTYKFNEQTAGMYVIKVRR